MLPKLSKYAKLLKLSTSAKEPQCKQYVSRITPIKIAARVARARGNQAINQRGNRTIQPYNTTTIITSIKIHGTGGPEARGIQSIQAFVRPLCQSIVYNLKTLNVNDPQLKDYMVMIQQVINILKPQSKFASGFTLEVL